MTRLSAKEIEELARKAVACCRSEFPGEGPDWDSDWWCGWRDGWQDGEFSEFLAACKAAWGRTPEQLAALTDYAEA